MGPTEHINAGEKGYTLNTNYTLQNNSRKQIIILPRTMKILGSTVNNILF